MKTYFITGATGSIGSAIVPLLLKEDDVGMRLLIRALDKQHLNERLQKLCDYWNVRLVDIQDRVKAILGDMALDRFGLKQAVYDDLTKECTHIIHCGGVVRMNLPLEDARKAALGSAQNIISFAEECTEQGTLQKIEYVSTVGIAGRLAGIVPEEWITQPRSFHNSYEQAKAEAEILMVEKIKEGLPITVHRPSMVVGDSNTGKIIHFQVFYYLCEFLSGKKTAGFVPRLGDLQLDTIPIDYVADVIVLSSARPEWNGKILHLCSGPVHAVRISFLRQLIEQIYVRHNRKISPTRNIPFSLFKNAIPLLKPFSSTITKRALNALPYFFMYLEVKQSFSNTETVKLVSAEDIVLPRPENYMKSVLTYYLEKTSAKN